VEDHQEPGDLDKKLSRAAECGESRYYWPRIDKSFQPHDAVYGACLRTRTL
jgi:hypothetical protein